MVDFESDAAGRITGAGQSTDALDLRHAEPAMAKDCWKAVVRANGVVI
jgi:hypothetical protein